MKLHWLFGFPEGIPVDKGIAWANQAVSADPEAQAIGDLEAEQFVAVGYMLLWADSKTLHMLKQAMRVHIASDTQQGRRRAVTLMLRQWKLKTFRDLLVSMVPRTCMGRFLDPELNPGLWTEAFFRQAYAEEMNICFLARFKRYLDPTVDLAEWLAALDKFAPDFYELWVNVGRLTLRRLVYPPAVPVRPAQEAAPGLMTAVRSTSDQSGALRQNVRRLEQDRKRLKADARRQELERRQLISQAQGELAAARRRLNDRRHEMQQELTQRTKRHEAELTSLHRELERTQAEFLSALRERTANLLCGRPMSVTGGDPRENRVLVETLGGRLVTADPAAVVDGSGGAAALERQLHGVALSDLQIRCDGSRRRKGRRPAIATSAYMAHADGRPFHHARRVVCCGTIASSMMAEYAAVVMALSWLLAAGPAPGSRVGVWSDCKYMVNHVTGRRPLKLPRGCVGLDRKLRSLLRSLRQSGCAVNLRWVPRDEVYACDRLCEMTYRETDWYHRPGGDVRRLPLADFLRSLPARASGPDDAGG